MKDFINRKENREEVQDRVHDVGMAITRIDRALKFSEGLAAPEFPKEPPLSPMMLSVH